MTDINRNIFIYLLYFEDTFTEHDEQVYECCPETYQSVRLIIKIRQRSTFFFMNKNANDTEDN